MEKTISVKHNTLQGYILNIKWNEKKKLITKQH